MKAQQFVRLILLTMALAALPLGPLLAETVCQKVSHPCTALVLGGGGARGAAHVGALKAIEEHGIQIDLIVGTSIGAFVGGLYASGKAPAYIERFFLKTDWNTGYDDSINRADLSNRRKEQHDQFQMHLDIGVDHQGMHLPTGLIQGQKMKGLIDRSLGFIPVLPSFDELPIPFRAVGADIESGKPVLLTNGDLASVMQISMSLPGILRPVEHNGRLLVDGGIAMNLPISVAKAAGADRIIAIDVGAPTPEQDQLQSGLSVMRQLSSHLVHINVERQKALLGNDDVLITPIMEGVTLLSFDRVATAIAAGYRDTQAALVNIAKQPAITHADVQNQEEQWTFSDIALDNNSRLSDQYIEQRLGLTAGQAYTMEEIHKGIDYLYAQGTIARIYSNIEKQADADPVLNVRVDEKEWGPGYMDLKFTFEDDFHRSSQFQVGALYRRTNLTKTGAELATHVEIGTDKRLNIDFHLPLGYSHFFLNSIFEAESQVIPFNLAELNYGTYRSQTETFIQSIGWSPVDYFDIRLGGLYENASAETPAIIKQLTGLSQLDIERSGALFSARVDRLDNFSFPTQGWRVDFEAMRTRDRFQGNRFDTTQYNLDLDYLLPIADNHTVHSAIRYHSTLNDNEISPLGQESLGGFLSLSGNASEFISGAHTRLGRIVYRYKLASNNLRIFQLPVYAGLSLEAGNAWASERQIDYSDLIHSASVFLGWLSPAGPLYFGYGLSDTGQESLYLSLGVSF